MNQRPISSTSLGSRQVSKQSSVSRKLQQENAVSRRSGGPPSEFTQTVVPIVGGAIVIYAIYVGVIYAQAFFALNGLQEIIVEATNYAQYGREKPMTQEAVFKQVQDYLEQNSIAAPKRLDGGVDLGYQQLSPKRIAINMKVSREINLLISKTQMTRVIQSESPTGAPYGE